ncbi:MAG: SPOR domain-containing protein [Bacteroidota bacterium]
MQSKLYQHIAFILIFLISLFSWAQNNDAKPIEDESTIKELIEIKKELNERNQLKESYRIQLFSGRIENAEKLKEEYETEFDFEYPITIIYETPNYKVWVGHFRNRLEADRALVKLKEEFEKALILKPGRN